MKSLKLIVTLSALLERIFAASYWHSFVDYHRPNPTEVIDRSMNHRGSASGSNLIYAASNGNLYIITTSMNYALHTLTPVLVHTANTRTTASSSRVEAVCELDSTVYVVMGTSGQTSTEHPKLIKVDRVTFASTSAAVSDFTPLTDIAVVGDRILTGPYLRYWIGPNYSAGNTFGDGSTYLNHKYRYITCASTTACYAGRDVHLSFTSARQIPAHHRLD